MYVNVQHFDFQASPDSADVPLLQLFLHDLIFHLNFLCTVFSSSMLPDLKALFFSFRRAFISGVIQGLLLRKTLYNPSGYNVFLTEVNIICDAVCKAVDVLPVKVSEHIPRSSVKTMGYVL